MKAGLEVPMKHGSRYGLRILILAVLVGVTAGAARAQLESVLYSFPGGHNGSQPYGSLVFDSAGNLYGTTWEGGQYGYGSVFKLAPLAGGLWQESLIYSFKGGKDSGFPWAGVTIDSEGNLFGTTTDDSGFHGSGTVFELTPASSGSWQETILYRFRGGEDGGVPYGRLVLDPAGNLYGTTFEGGSVTICTGSASGCGVVFELSHAAGGNWKEHVLYAFKGGNDGAFPEAGIVFDHAGNIYGSTGAGGGSRNCGTGCGTVFELARSANGWKESVLHAFDLGPTGGTSNAPLVVDSVGNLYGTTEAGGIVSGNCGAGGCGVVFELSPDSGGQWSETVLHSFMGGFNDGSNPAEGGLIIDEAGNLYGTTAFGGVLDAGVVYGLSASTSWNETLLHVFTAGNDGQYPFAAPVLDNAGNFYGTTTDGGTGYLGVVFKITK